MSAASVHLLGLKWSWSECTCTSFQADPPPHILNIDLGVTLKQINISSFWSGHFSVSLCCPLQQKRTLLFCSFYRESGCHVIQKEVKKKNSLNPDIRMLLFICLCVEMTSFRKVKQTHFRSSWSSTVVHQLPPPPNIIFLQILKTESDIPRRKHLVILPLLIHV